MLRDTNTAVLLISIDPASGIDPLMWGGVALEAIGSVMPDAPDWYNSLVNSVNSSDVKIIENRLAIPLTDGIMPVHMTGYQMHHNLGVTNQEVVRVSATEQQAANKGITGAQSGYKVSSVFSPGTNQVTLQFEMKGIVRSIQALADLFFQQSSSMRAGIKRVTFISSTLFIRDATLVGINRSSVPGTDKEMVSITLEVDTGETERERTAKLKLDAEEKLWQETLKNSSGGTTPLATYPRGSALQAVQGYGYYRLMSLAEIEAAPVPDFTAPVTVRRSEVRVFSVNSESRTGGVIAQRNLIGVEYGGELLTMVFGSGQKYRGRIGLLVNEYGDVFLALKQ